MLLLSRNGVVCQTLGSMSAFRWQRKVRCEMSMERDTLASNFADAGARGLIDIKFCVQVDKDTTVDSLRAAVNRSETAIRESRVTDFVVDDEGLVTSEVDRLLYSIA